MSFYVREEWLGKASRDQDVSHMCNFFSFFTFFLFWTTWFFDKANKPLSTERKLHRSVDTPSTFLDQFVCLTWLAHPLGTFIPRITGSSRLPNLFNEFPATRTSISKCTNFPVYWDFRLQNQSRWSLIFIGVPILFLHSKLFTLSFFREREKRR